MAVFRIPASILADAREATLSLVHDALDDMAEPLTRPASERDLTWHLTARARLEHLWHLLDLIGWYDGQDENEVALELSEYGPTVLVALLGHADSYVTWEQEAEQSDAWRVARGERKRADEIRRRATAVRDFTAKLQELLAKGA